MRPALLNGAHVSKGILFSDRALRPVPLKAFMEDGHVTGG